MDWGLIQGAATGLKLGIDLHKAIQDGKVQIESQGLVLEALGKLSDVQTALLALQAELFRLQGENQQLKDKASSKAEWQEKLAGTSLFKRRAARTSTAAKLHRRTTSAPPASTSASCTSCRTIER